MPNPNAGRLRRYDAMELEVITYEAYDLRRK
jgi:hypothetical protein